MTDLRSQCDQILYDNSLQILLTQEQVAEKVHELAQVITKDYRDKNPVLIGVLNGGFIFMADLVRHLELNVEIDFIKIASYGDTMTSSGCVRILKDVDIPITDRHVLVVEDIVDSGLSVQFLQLHLLKLKPASLNYVSLLLKENRARVNFKIDYVGFEIPDNFVVGYGLDYKQLLRNLPAIYVKQ